MNELRLLGVRAKVYDDERVAVLLYKEVDGEIQKFYLDDEGCWNLIPEGSAYPKLTTVFHEFRDFDVDLV